jgi:NitT/TauT family transport system substrate-binding protein
MHFKFKRLTAVVMCIVMVCSGLVGCSSKKAENNETTTTKLTLNEVAHSIFYAPQYVAIENGYFEEEGIELTLVTGFGADKVMTSLISGDADIGFMGSESSIYIYTGGSSDYAVNFAQLTQRAGNFLVSRDNITDFKWDDIKGKTVLGGRAGGMPQMLLEYILKKNGIDPETDVEIVQNIDFGSTAAAFASGLGDFTAEFEPSATAIEAEGKGYVVASLGVDSGYVPYTAYCAKKSYIEKNPEIIQSFTNAIQKGLDYVNSHTSAEIAAVIAPQFTETDTDTLTKIVERYKSQGTWKGDTIFTEESFNLLTDILKQAGELNEDVPYDKLVDTSFSEKSVK